MAGLKLTLFSGIRPSATEIRLEDSDAIFAQDVELRRGVLAPRKRQFVWNVAADPYLPVKSGDTPATIYRFRRNSDLYGDADFWLYWTTDVNVVPGPVANISDSDQRHYFTGDGLPKEFTADSLIESAPPHDEVADTKYPYIWFYLGVPAPDSAPVIDSSRVVLPTDAAPTGNITELSSAYLIMYPKSQHYGGSDSTIGNFQRDSSYTQYFDGTFSTGRQVLGPADKEGTGIIEGTRMVVTSVVDADHVVVGGLEGSDMIVDVAISNSNWYLNGNNTDYRARMTYDGTASTYRWAFTLPSGTTLKSVGHIMVVGDIIRITSLPTPMLYEMADRYNFRPQDVGQYKKQATPVDVHAEGVVFKGNLLYLIERGGQEIDPTVAVNTGTSAVSQSVEVFVRSYVYTNVTHLGEESAPSPPSELVTLAVNNILGVSGFDDPPDNHRRITHRRLYRAATGSGDTEFLLVAELDVGTSQYDDNVDDSALGEPLPSADWAEPNPALTGIVMHPCGSIAGFYDNVVAVSEPGQCHAWPEDYRVFLDSQVVGLSVLGTSIIALTTGVPYVITFAHPRQMAPRRTAILHPCLDKRAIVNTGNEVLYPSPNGLVRIGTDGAVNLTESHYTREDWQKVVGAFTASARTLRAWWYDDQYILDANFVDGSLHDGVETKLVVDVKGGAVRISQFTEDVIAAFFDPGHNELFYVTNSSVHETPATTGLPANTMALLRWAYLSPGDT